MGVPSYFFWLINKYSRKILKGRIHGQNALFLDLNCAIHPAVKANPDFTIDDMIRACITYINDIISFTKNISFIYIAIDGVAPMAKMQQQRSRRYKSKIFASHEHINAREHNNPQEHIITKEIIDFNMISPGTEFMALLNNYIKTTFDADIKSGRIIFSGSDEPGEGEHKIFNYIRSNAIVKKNIVIYGLDSDLIFLSLINYNYAQKNSSSIYLLREKEQFGKMTTEKERYIYLDINYLRRVIYDMLHTARKEDISRIIADYVFFSFLLGNDFLPAIPTLFIREGGIELLMQSYTKILVELNEHLITCDYGINEQFLFKYMKELANAEQECIDSYISARKKRLLHKPKHNDAYIEGTTPDLIYEQFPPKSWKSRHYAHYFDIIGKSEIKKIWASYFTGMIWTLRYYIGAPVSWEWAYEYNAAPALSDIKEFILREEDITIKIMPTSLEQLLYIMPKSSAHLLPKELQIIMNNNNKLYPPEKEIKYCITNKKYLHEAICYLPYIDLYIIRKLLSQ